MSDFLRRPAEFTDPTVYDAEIVDLDALEPQPLAYPPAIREPEPVALIIGEPRSGKPPLIPAPCFCENITPRGHGRIDGRRGFTCEEILAMRRDVEHYSVSAWLRAWRRLTGRGGA
jgi:hypothetical protein